MSEEHREEIEKLQGHCCFACGTANPIGLNLKFYRVEDTVRTEITLGKYHEGWENMAHGGIVSTLLDETMSWVIIYFKKLFLVTRKMDVKYVKPVPIGTPLTVIARLTDDSDPPKIRTRAEIRDEKGSLLVRGRAEFVALQEEALTSVPEGLRKEMLELFEKFS